MSQLLGLSQVHIFSPQSPKTEEFSQCEDSYVKENQEMWEDARQGELQEEEEVQNQKQYNSAVL